MLETHLVLKRMKRQEEKEQPLPTFPPLVENIQAFPEVQPPSEVPAPDVHFQLTGKQKGPAGRR